MYDLRSLGWYDFQQLCLTITREVLGQTVESFLDSNDGGRDGAFAGEWSPEDQETLSGRFVIQCKFTSRVNHSLTPSDLSEEAEKVRRLVENNLCDSYVLMTNAGISGARAEKIASLFESVGVRYIRLLGSTWIDQQIRENKRLRMLVPRVYGLGDLSQILDERAYRQGRAVIDSMREELAKVVVTEAYRKAAEALNSHGFVLLIGEPAAGKTTIASLLAMAAIDQWGSSLLKLDEPGKVADRWNPDEPTQFFWLDDAFGVTQYEDFLVRRWNHILPHVNSMLRSGAKIVMTSRDYIYNGARQDLKDSAFPLLNESQVVIDVHDLSNDERRQILYNHIKLGRQPSSFRSAIKPYLEGVATHPRFIPETARRLADPLFTKDLLIDGHRLSRFVERREQLLQEVLQGLDIDSKAALALVYMRNGRLQSPIELQPPEVEAIRRLGSDLGGCVSALEALRGNLILLSSEDGESIWKFKHPTIGDAYATILVESTEHLGIYIQGTDCERLIHQVTCGDVGLERTVVIPRSLYLLMLNKLLAFSQSTSYKTGWMSIWGAKRDLQGFLSRRCSKEFLSLYLESNPDVLEQVSEPGLFLHAAPEVRLAERLHEYGLLPEEARKKFVKTVSDYALEGQDADALDDRGIRTLFTVEEFEQLLEGVRNDLVPRLSDVRIDWELQHSSDEDPDDHMQRFVEILGSLRKQFAGDASVIAIVDRETDRTNEWIAENSSAESTRAPRKLETVDAVQSTTSTRSIFDDIDVEK